MSVDRQLGTGGQLLVAGGLHVRGHFPREFAVGGIGHHVAVLVVQQLAFGNQAFGGHAQGADTGHHVAVVLHQHGGFGFVGQVREINRHLIRAVAKCTAGVGHALKAARLVFGRLQKLGIDAGG